MVEEIDSQDVPSLRESAGCLAVFTRRRRIFAGVIMGDDEAGRADRYRGGKNFSWMNETFGQGSP